MARGRALTPDRSEYGGLAPVGASAVAGPGWVVAGHGCRVTAIDGGRVTATEGSKAWVWDGGSGVGLAGSEIYVGRHGVVNAMPGAKVYAEGGRIDPPEKWPVVLSEGGFVYASAAHVYADGESNVTMVERGTLTTVGCATVQIRDGREVDWVRSTDLPSHIPKGVVFEAARPRLTLSGEPDPGQTPEEWMEPVLDVLRSMSARVEEYWTRNSHGHIRAFYGKVREDELCQRMAMPGSVTIKTRSNGRILEISSIYGSAVVLG